MPLGAALILLVPDRCKKLVVAEKSFSINEAPMVLTVHLKRFTAAGRKISEPIGYPEVLDLKPYMSDVSPLVVSPTCCV